MRTKSFQLRLMVLASALLTKISFGLNARKSWRPKQQRVPRASQLAKRSEFLS